MAPHACHRVFDVPRVLVSQNKRRFQENGFNLDLSYVHPRVIVMGYPAIGVEGLFRNPRSQVRSLLEERHGDNYFVFNFCDEPKRSYSPSTFEGRIKHFPIEDHNVPTFQMMILFCEEAAAWLDASDRHVVVLHCKAGKGRAGMMACMFLLRMGYAATASDAIDRYNQASVPQTSLVEPAFSIRKLVLHNTLTAKKLPKLRLRIFTLTPDGSPKTLLHQDVGFNEFQLHQVVRGCVMIDFYRDRMNGCMQTKHFKLWFNTYFLKPDKETGLVAFSRSEMDWVARDKKYRRLPAAFEVKMVVSCSAS
ncbi:unnamed protein product [Peronospora belbahrii]|uniref:Phosphatidylinositol-3,4,5-trisphosphate 3-phosphatase n=1 Tax=Peronospora belbahrii TaxID=622444 RepID=A0ABN8CU74_9STRA|nr:unnamed protein product [Peronospora belbahrii]